MYTHKRVDDLEEVVQIIGSVFEGDKALFDKYHLINGDTDLALKDTADKIVECLKNYGATFYKILFGENETVIGYINLVEKEHLLHSFGLNFTHRNEEAKKYLVELIEEKLAGVITCSLYGKNKRAISFLRKAGYMEQDVVTLTKVAG